MRIARFFGTVAVLASAGVAAVALIRVLETQIDQRVEEIENDRANRHGRTIAGPARSISSVARDTAREEVYASSLA